jgi:hypothetical protein
MGGGANILLVEVRLKRTKYPLPYTVQIQNASMFSLSGSTHPGNAPCGATFTNGIECPGCGPGASKAFSGPLDFTVTYFSGININSFIAIDLAPYRAERLGQRPLWLVCARRTNSPLMSFRFWRRLMMRMPKDIVWAHRSWISRLSTHATEVMSYDNPRHNTNPPSGEEMIRFRIGAQRSPPQNYKTQWADLHAVLYHLALRATANAPDGGHPPGFLLTSKISFWRTWANIFWSDGKPDHRRADVKNFHARVWWPTVAHQLNPNESTCSRSPFGGGLP